LAALGGIECMPTVELTLITRLHHFSIAKVPKLRSNTLSSQLWARKSIDKLIAESEEPERRLKKTLGPWSLTALGIGAVIGSGIFTVIGTAIAGQKFDTSSILNAPLLDYLIHHTATLGRPGAGPALALSLVLVAIVCAFTALCYAELASMIPIAGSAYTYTYATLGELIAWIIGWDLILEYAVSNIAVSIGFAAHMVDLLDWFGVHPSLRWISPAYLPGGLTDLQGNVLYAPGFHFGFNVPAFLVVMLLTMVLVRGIRESAETNNVMVLLKIAAILIFVFAGAQFIRPSHWHPFAPSGWSGILTGGSIIFFTYIGFDSVSTAAEEARNPQRDLPIGIIATLVICTVLYIGVAVVLTGLVPWQTLIDNAAPVVNSLKELATRNHSATLHWVRLAVLFGAMMGMISSLLVFQLGQARVWFSMSRDGLMPRLFGKVHPRFRTPAFSTWVAGFAVGIPAGVLDIGTAADLSNIGTLFAFVLVSLGVIILRYRQPDRARGFRAPGGIVFPVLSVIFCALLMAGLPILTWLRFFGWLVIGLVIYVTYSRRHSEFAHRPPALTETVVPANRP
jgi:APA family basic amino acid/polyamine antiporter